MSVRQLPVSPDAHHIRRQAKNLLRAFRAGDAPALEDFRAFGSREINAENANLSDAQLVLARSYGANSFPQLLAACEFILACWSNDGNRVREAVLAHAEILKDYYKNPHDIWREDLKAAAMRGLGGAIRYRRDPGVSLDATERQQHARELAEILVILRKLAMPFHRTPAPPIIITAKRETPVDEQEELRKRAEKAVRDATEDDARLSQLEPLMKRHAQDPTRINRHFERMRAHNVPYPALSPLATPEQRRRHDVMRECFRLYIESHPQ